MIIFGSPCRQCGKATSARVDEVVGGDDLRGHLCETCYDEEQKAYGVLLDHLAQTPAELAHCEECLKTVEQAGGKLYMHVAHGVVALLCRQCSDKATALMDTKTVRGRLKHLNKEEMFRRMLIEHLHKRRKGVSIRA